MRAALLVGVLVVMYLSWAYGAMMRGNALNVDIYTGKEARFSDRMFVAFTHWCVCVRRGGVLRFDVGSSFVSGFCVRKSSRRHYFQ